MATERNGDESVERLRDKYARLAEKYAELVHRIEDRVERDATLLRRRWFGIRTKDAAIAVVEHGKLTFTNNGWRGLGMGDAPWVSREDPESPPRRYPHFAALALGEARLALASPMGTSIVIFEARGTAATVQVRAEVVSRADERVALLADDVSAGLHRETELLQLREALLEKEHLRILGELTTSVTHELGSTMRGIQARIDALALEPALASRRPMLASLNEYVAGALDRLRELHHIALSGRLTPVPVHLDDILRHASSALNLDRDPDRPIVLDLQLGGLPRVIGSPAELSHLFVTLLRNAREAMPKGGRISVVGRRRGNFLTVTVCDEGPGIRKEVMTHLFEPFFTTKGRRGTGLGLWLAASTMRRLGGTIRATNRRGAGAEFVLRFPLEGQKAVRKPSSAPGARRRRPGQRVPA